MKDLRKIIDDFIKKMEGINERRVDLASKELNFVMHEAKAFNEMRQQLLIIDSKEIKEHEDGIPEDK